MKQTAFVAAATLVFGSLAFAADPQLMNMVMPDAKVMAGINVEQAKTSAFGQFVLAMMPANSGFEQFISTTGFDPRRDLHEVLIASTGDAGHKAGLILARGNFNLSGIAAAALKEGHHTSQTYKGVQLLTSTDGKGHEAMALIDSNIVAAGDLDSVKAALDRRAGANSVDPQLAVRVNQLSASEDAWSVSIAPISSLMGTANAEKGAHAQAMNVFKSIQQSSGGVKFGSVVQINGEALAASEKDATSLGDVLKFLASMIQANGPKNSPVPLSDLIKNLSVTTEGATLKVSLGIPEDQLETLVKAMHAHEDSGAVI